MGVESPQENISNAEQDLRGWRRLTLTERITSFLLSTALVMVVLLARWLEPDPSGVGTHEQLGLAPCTFHWVLGLPCPFCGMTTAFSHLAHGHVVTAFVVQPAGALFFIGVLVAIAAGMACGTGGYVPAWAIAKLTTPTGLYIFAGMVCLAWVYNIARTVVSG